MILYNTMYILRFIISNDGHRILKDFNNIVYGN